ncbi:ABC transporter permease [Solidesulfovibrio alcoholivorans]|uniref:ABC transporter permease n=1 Tax=Solidesulfovibrio alcoholivorans TaxID=81406 RepID=UPI0004971C87|nr:ABC transporter permease [Solidesulfovibrio alcoholivorans]
MLLLRLIVKNAFRHRLRSLLTIVGVAIALTAFGLMRTVLDAWHAGVSASSANRLVTRNAVSLTQPLPYAYKGRIRQVTGVDIVAAGNWFGGVYLDEKNFFANFAMEAEDFFRLYPELVVSPVERKAFLADRKAAVIGRKLAARFHWRVGDTITLRGTIFPGQWPMTIRAIYKGARPDTDETVLYLHWSYVDEVMKKTTPRRAGQTGFFMVGIDDATKAAEISKNIDAIFRNSQAETLTETEKAFQMGFVSMSEAILMAITVVSYVVIVIILAVAANTMAMSARERLGEFAVLKTLGFSGPALGLMLLAESLLLSLSGAALAMGLLPAITDAFAKHLAEYFPIFFVSRETMLLIPAFGAAVGVLAAVAPAVRVGTVRIAEAFRRIG